MADAVTLYEKRGRRYVPVAERDTLRSYQRDLRSMATVRVPVASAPDGFCGEMERTNGK